MLPYRQVFLPKLRRNPLSQNSGRQHRRRPTIHALVSILLGYHSASLGNRFTTFWDHYVFRYVGNRLPCEAASHPRRTEPPLRKPKNSPIATLSFYYDTESRGKVRSTKVVLGTYLGLNTKLAHYSKLSRDIFLPPFITLLFDAM